MTTESPRLPEQRTEEPADARVFTAWATTTRLEQDDRDGIAEHTVLRGID